MTVTLIFFVAGVLFIVMALGGTLLNRLPLTTSLIYLGVGYLLGSHGLGLVEVDIVADSRLIEHLTEIAVIVSLFTAGLKLRVSWNNPFWKLPFRLAVGSMAITVALIACVGVAGLGLSLGAAILLGAILAPTDPVLASDVQVADPQDRDRVRFGLTGEAGLNDGAAFPFVMLGLGVLGHHRLGDVGWRWLTVDVIWASAGGLVIGAVLGTAVGRLVLFLRREHNEAVGLDEFLVFGLIAIAYSGALLAHTYGFLAVFTAGLALRRIERRSTDVDFAAVIKELDARDDATMAVQPETAPAFMTRALLGFNEQLERIGEVAIVVLVGLLLASNLTIDALWFVPVLLLLIRPAAVWLGLHGSRTDPGQRHLMAWFGIRGIGSLYYLAFAISHGLDDALSRRLAELTVSTIAISVIVHGISVTPLMTRYEQRPGRIPRADAKSAA